MSKLQGTSGVSSQNSLCSVYNYKVELTTLPADSPYRVIGGDCIDFLLANRLLRALSVRGLASHSIRSYAYDLMYILRWLKGAKLYLESLKGADIIEFIAAQRASSARPRSINRRLVTCNVFYRFGFNKDIPGSPGMSSAVPYYRGRGYEQLGLFVRRRPTGIHIKVKVPRTLIEPLTPEAVAAFFKTMSRYRDLAIVTLMLLSGLRSCEILSLRTSDIDLPNREARLRGKGGKERVIPLSDHAIAILKKYLRLERPVNVDSTLFLILQGNRRGLPMTPAGLRSLFRHRRKNHKLSQANAHRFRHTFGTDMARSGVQLPVIQRMMGHADAATTLQYIELSMADIADDYYKAMEKLKKRYDHPE
ncbi:MAG: tyrosine-type recombinase/integrase [Oligoflexales bacterium]